MRAPVGTIILLGLAAVFYAGMMSCLVDAPASDAFGRSLALVYAAVLAGVLWLVLAALLVVAAIRGRLPIGARVAAVILWPLSCVAVWLASDAYGARDSSAIWVPGLLPPLIALYALWARFPSLHTRLHDGATSAVLGAAIAFLTLAPLVAATRASLPDPAREARLEAAGKANEERIANEARQAREREEAQFARLGPDSSLGDYLIYLSSMTYAERALAGIRQLKSREADAISLLQGGRIGDLRELSQFKIEPSAALCQAYGAALAGAAGTVTRARTDYLMMAMDLELQLPNMEWLIANQCDLGPSLALLETNVRAVADSDRMTGFADKLAALRRLK